MYPLKFSPILKPTIWGGEKIAAFKQIKTDEKQIGESWEISCLENNETVVVNGEDKGSTIRELIRKYKEELVGESNYKCFGDTFPLLIKFIDAQQDLSVQVHPNDALAKKRHNSLGKTEMWYVASADKGTKIYAGFKETLSAKEYKDHIYKNTLANTLQAFDAKEGDVFFIPAGTVHAIGGGAFIVEIQETSDITYRIYDYDRVDAQGKKRELHTEQSKEAIDYERREDLKVEYDVIENEPVEIVSCTHFTTSVYDMSESINCDYSELDSFVILICIDGECDVTDNEGNEVRLSKGETILLPAAIQEVNISPIGDRAKLLEVYS